MIRKALSVLFALAAFFCYIGAATAEVFRGQDSNLYWILTCVFVVLAALFHLFGRQAAASDFIITIPDGRKVAAERVAYTTREGNIVSLK